MALDEADRLSLLALIVAIVALIVSSWQLAQQLFATAIDGKRFCQGSVMGIWARKTHLSWRWTSIRFEAKYTTPEIRMTSGIKDVDYATDGAVPKSRWSRFLRFPFGGFVFEARHGPLSDWDRYFEVTSDQPDLPMEMRKTTRPEKPMRINSMQEAISWWLISMWDRSYNEYKPDVVSWPVFLQWIYRNQINCIRKVEPREADDTGDAVDAKQLEDHGSGPDFEAPYRRLTGEEREQGEDRVVVRLVERSWDLIPPDVVRPLAKSTVGTMIVITHRLGMSWLDVFNPNEGKMNAAGCGHTLSSETVRGLGTVLQYTVHQESKALKNFAGSSRGLGAGEYLSPTTTADKLHCGCLPVDDAAVHPLSRGELIHLIDVTRKVELSSLLYRLGVPIAEMDMLRGKTGDKQGTGGLNQYGSPGRGLKHCIEEAVSLLCPIPTLPESRARFIVWPFRSMRQPFTPFRQKEGVQELRDQLSEYLKAGKPGTNIMANRENSNLKHLSKSPLEYLDFLLAAFKPLRPKHIASTEESAQSACEIYRQILQIHKETSAVFAELSNSIQTNDEESKPFLIDMVGAQVTLAAKYGRRADGHAIAEGAKENIAEGDTRPIFIRELARLYVEDLHDSQERTIRKHLRRTGHTHKIKPGEAPALWWTAVVRSVCWFMSVQIRLPETQIPSIWYDSQTPVYIT